MLSLGRCALHANVYTGLNAGLGYTSLDSRMENRDAAKMQDFARQNLGNMWEAVATLGSQHQH